MYFKYFFKNKNRISIVSSYPKFYLLHIQLAMVDQYYHDGNLQRCPALSCLRHASVLSMLSTHV